MNNDDVTVVTKYDMPALKMGKRKKGKNARRVNATWARETITETRSMCPWKAFITILESCGNGRIAIAQK